MEQSLKITDIGSNGDGIARLESGEVVFVPFAAKGDIVMADVARDKDGYRGKINSVLLKSPDRATPPCRHFGICGGCSLQHLNDNAYRALKQSQIEQAFEKFGVEIPADFETVFIPHGTRRRANFAARVNKGKTTIGFHERKSGNIRDVPDCWLITNELRDAMEKFRPFIADIIGEGEKIDILIQCIDGQTEIGLTGKIASGWEAQQALSDALRATDASRISLRTRDFEPYEILLDAKPFYKAFDSLIVNLAPGAFLQPSAEGERALTKCVTDGADDAKRIADLFCGNGTFTGPLMEGHDIWAADFAPDAIASLQKAGVKAELRNLFKEPYTVQGLEDRDCIILDPPRAGAGAQVDILAGMDIPTIVYVSCAPQSFAKDARVLIDGGYELQKLTLVDQFIWSAHTEIAAVFKKA